MATRIATETAAQIRLMPTTLTNDMAMAPIKWKAKHSIAEKKEPEEELTAKSYGNVQFYSIPNIDGDVDR